MTKYAVVVVDLQNDYLSTGAWPLVGVDAAVERAARVIETARTRGALVVHIRHESPAGAPFFVAGSTGADIIPAVAPKAGEEVVVKNYPNAFRDTDLKTRLDRNGVTDVVVVGAMSHMCIDATARAAADYGYNVTVVWDAVATRDLAFGNKVVPASDVHAAYMSALAFAYGKVISTDEFISAQ